MRIIVAGGTGAAGRSIVEEASRRAHKVVALARSKGVDLLEDRLEGVLEGADAVVDASNVSTLSDAAARRFFTGVTRRLLEAERATGVGHHLGLSIVGIDRATTGYFAAKLEQESVIRAGSVPWSIVRATPLHEFARSIYTALHIGPIRFAPRMRTRPVAGAAVAERLLQLIEAGPSARIDELAGPLEAQLVDMVRAYARAVGDRSLIVPISLPGEYGRMQRDGSVLPAPGARIDGRTFDDWLASLRVTG